jgi:hypothetical protein
LLSSFKINSDRTAIFWRLTRSEFFAQQHTNDGAVIHTCLGWHVGMLNGESLCYKEGGGGGFQCMMRLYPNSGIGTVAMINATGSM